MTVRLVGSGTSSVLMNDVVVMMMLFMMMLGSGDDFVRVSQGGCVGFGRGWKKAPNNIT